jgi:hypothetical protein
VPQSSWLMTALGALQEAARFDHLHVCLTVPSGGALSTRGRAARAGSAPDRNREYIRKLLLEAVAPLGRRAAVVGGSGWELRIGPSPCHHLPGTGNTKEESPSAQ